MTVTELKQYLSKINDDVKINFILLKRNSLNQLIESNLSFSSNCLCYDSKNKLTHIEIRFQE